MTKYDFCGNDYDGYFNVVFSPSNVCNFQCSYCIANTKGKRVDKIRDIDYSAIIEKLGKFFNNLPNKVNIDVGGNGEPTLHPITIPLMEHLCGLDNLNEVKLFTNMSCSYDYLDECIERTKGKFLVVCSYHREFTDYDDIVGKINHLSDNGIGVIVSLAMVPEDFDECVDLYHRLRGSCPDDLVYISPNILTSEDEIPIYKTYTKEQQQFFHEYVESDTKFRYDGRELTRSEVKFEVGGFRGWFCKDGLKNFHVDLLGNVTSSCQQHGKLGNIYFDTIDFSKGFDVDGCPMVDCLCNHKLQSPKKRK